MQRRALGIIKQTHLSATLNGAILNAALYLGLEISTVMKELISSHLVMSCSCGRRGKGGHDLVDCTSHGLRRTSVSEEVSKEQIAPVKHTPGWCLKNRRLTTIATINCENQWAYRGAHPKN